MSPSKNIIIAAFVLIVGLGLGYWFGTSQAYDRGYNKAIADAQATQEAAAKRAAEEAARAANPFQAEQDVLKGVTTNPIDKTKKILNPFE